MRTAWLQILRRATQVSVLVALLGIITVNLYAHYRAARALEDLEGLRGRALMVVDRFCSRFDDPQPWLDRITGTLWSLKVGPIEFTDPLAAAETVAASRRLYGPLLWSVLLPVGVTVLLGRVFCSWICPGTLLFEFGGLLRRLLRLAEIRPAEVRFARANKFIFLVVGLVFAAATGLPLFATIYPPAVISRLLHAWVFGTALTALWLVLGALLLIEVFVSPRWWCRTMCPGGALYAALGSGRVLRVICDPATCTGCRRCHPVCPMGLEPERQSTSPECDNCGVCLRHCPEGSLRLTLSVPGRRIQEVQS